MPLVMSMNLLKVSSLIIDKMILRSQFSPLSLSWAPSFRFLCLPSCSLSLFPWVCSLLLQWLFPDDSDLYCCGMGLLGLPSSQTQALPLKGHPEGLAEKVNQVLKL